MVESPPFSAMPTNVEAILKEYAHSALTLWLTALLDDRLDSLLQNHMTHLSSELRKKFFESDGPLGTFSSRIDLAYMLNKIDQPLRSNLHAMRGDRNFFAHSTKRETLSAEKPQKFLKTLSTYKSDRDPLQVFFDAFTKCSDAFAPAEERTVLVKALVSYKPKMKPS